MEVREVRMAMADRGMQMGMAVGLARRNLGLMDMLMVPVVDVGVRVFEGLVLVLMIVRFGDMKPHAHPHQDRSEPRVTGHGLA